jgi:hypothetical protein
MTVQVADAVANAMIDAWETVIGASPIMRLRTGAQPANVAAASTGTVCATLVLPADWMANAATRAKALLGTWQDLQADAAGLVAHYEIVKADGTTRMEQGSVTITGGGGDLTLDNPQLALNQQVNITSFARSFPSNA